MTTPADIRVLCACEESQAVCKAFRARGISAYSCDIQPCSGGRPEWHIQDDVIPVLYRHWDMVIAFPPCTHLAVSGCRWFDKKIADGRQQRGIDFFMAMVNTPAKHVAVENPVSIMSTRYRKPNQIIHPYMFGDGERKSTCLWLKNLPLLVPTNIVPIEYITGKNGKQYTKTHYGSCFKTSKEDQARMRSKTYQGIADAMAAQWGAYVIGLAEVPV